MAPAAFWASWVDALPMLSQRLPALTDQIMQSLDSVHDGGCLEQLQAAGLSLDRGGFLRRPEWAQLRAGARPPLTPSAEPGEWQHGWQYHASSPLEHHFRETVILAQSCATSSVELQLRKSLRWNPISSVISCWTGSVSHWMLPVVFASAGADWTQRGDIGQRAQDQAGCAHGLSDQRELSPAFAVRRVRWSDATPNSVT